LDSCFQSVSAGIAGYLAGIVVITAGYALFQAANNTAIMTGVQAEQRGVVSGMLSLSRNLGLITGASMMGALFASRAADITTASPEAVAGGMRITFGAAAILIAAALTIAPSSGYFSFDSFRPRSMSSGSTIGSRPRNAR